MKTKIILFFVWVWIVSNLFYQEYWGLNALIVTITSIAIVGTIMPKNLKSSKWWLVSVCWLISALAIFNNGTIVPGLLYFVSFLFFFAVSNRTQLSLFTGGLQSLVSWSTGFYFSFNRLFGSMNNLGDHKAKKTIANIIITLSSLIIIIIFLKLYQAADPTFYEWTKFLNLKWISWGFIFFYLFMLVFLYGFFFYRQEEGINQLEDDRVNDVPLTYTDRVQRFLGQKTEFKAGIVLLIILNLFLLLYNIIDIRYVLFVMDSGARGTTDSIMVHDGVNSLIGSIVLVILLISFFFRGGLNFIDNKALKALALFWLIQNISMVATTSVKSFEYISHYGLTYKRIGVLIYLTLALIGIAFTLYKLTKNKSFWFLARSTSVAFLFVGTVLVTVNWNRAIAWHNLNFITAAEIDFRYLVELGPDTYPYILEYNAEEGIEDKSIIYDLSREVPRVIELIELRKSEHSWRSMVWSDEVLLRDLGKHKFTYYAPIAERWDD